MKREHGEAVGLLIKPTVTKASDSDCIATKASVGGGPSKEIGCTMTTAAAAAAAAAAATAAAATAATSTATATTT
eukprot:15927791-Heterocapsa_arctica.AAC.1